jgi:hypothetical protein
LFVYRQVILFSAAELSQIKNIQINRETTFTMQQNILVMSPTTTATATTTCANIRSRKYNTDQCPNPPTYGEFCGIHYKNPKPWKSPTTVQKAKADTPRTRSELLVYKKEVGKKLWNWYKKVRGQYLYRTRGPAYFVRSTTTNDNDFFSADAVSDISGVMFFSYKDMDNHIYAFDIRSIHSLIHRARISGTPPQNPFTRTNLDIVVIRRVHTLVKQLQAHRISCEWAPLEPPTPEQQLCMKIVDLFRIIDELNYYSSPDWFLKMDLDHHLRFYSELHSIWTHRAGLSNAQKTSIVPGFTQLFRHPPWALRGQSLAAMQKLNMNTIRTLITSAEDRNDRILGAMYVVSTLTLVNEDARRAYPWLYESVYDASAPESPARDAPVEGLADRDRERRNGVPFLNFLGIQWIQELLRADTLPPLRLPPPAADREESDSDGSEDID